MSRSKKVFLILAVIFFIAMLYFAYDFSSRTTFPGHKREMEEKATVTDPGGDLSDTDTISPDSLPK